MKKKIANAVQLVLLIASFIILCSDNITINTFGSASAIQLLKDGFSAWFVPVYVLYALSAVMCIISIISKNTYKDGKAHGAIAILLFIYTFFIICFCESS